MPDSLIPHFSKFERHLSAAVLATATNQKYDLFQDKSMLSFARPAV
jgi:hypothetical protein